VHERPPRSVGANKRLTGARPPSTGGELGNKAGAVSMIETVVEKVLTENAEINDYCEENIHIGNAPDGAEWPYIVINASDSMEADNVISVFNVSVTIYDHKENNGQIRAVSKLIKDLLDYETFENDPENNYKRIRFWFEDRAFSDGTKDERDGNDNNPDLSVMTINFNCRAIEVV
jgi:hypothetical protein